MVENPSLLTFVFEDKQLMEEFEGWFFDGGGEDNFHDAMNNRGVEVDINYKTGVVFVNNLEGE